jgi:predicted DNA-binding transcriptional regulator YafY
MEPRESVKIVYTNYRGETAMRHVTPKSIRFGETEWHRESQWILDAFDHDKNADRSFAIKDIRCWFVQ